jgi:hypothetical protein
MRWWRWWHRSRNRHIVRQISLQSITMHVIDFCLQGCKRVLTIHFGVETRHDWGEHLLLCVGSWLAPQVKRACLISRLNRDFDFDNATNVATCSVNLLVVSFVIASCNPESRENGSSRPGAPDTSSSEIDNNLCQYSNRQILARIDTQSVCSAGRSDRLLFFFVIVISFDMHRITNSRSQVSTRDQ